MIKEEVILAHAGALGGRIDLFACDLSRDTEAGSTMLAVARGMDRDGVRANLPQLAARAAAGQSLYIRSADTAAGPLMLDDLDAQGIEAALRDGLPALCVTETSLGNHQIWFAAPGPDPLRVRAALLRRLSARWGGDPMAADARQVGRLAGAPNTKPGRGGFPCRLAQTFLPPPCPDWLFADLGAARAEVVARLAAIRARDIEVMRQEFVGSAPRG